MSEATTNVEILRNNIPMVIVREAEPWNRWANKVTTLK